MIIKNCRLSILADAGITINNNKIPLSENNQINDMTTFKYLQQNNLHNECDKLQSPWLWGLTITLSRIFQLYAQYKKNLC